MALIGLTFDKGKITVYKDGVAAGETLVPTKNVCLRHASHEPLGQRCQGRRGTNWM